MSSFELFKRIISDNLTNSLTILLLQIIVILITVRIFSFLFKYIGQPGVMGEIVAGIVLGPSLLGYFFPEFSATLFPPESLMNLNLLSQIGLVLFMFVIGLELDFSVIKDKLKETLVISCLFYTSRCVSETALLRGLRLGSAEGIARSHGRRFGLDKTPKTNVYSHHNMQSGKNIPIKLSFAKKERHFIQYLTARHSQGFYIYALKVLRL